MTALQYNKYPRYIIRSWITLSKKYDQIMQLWLTLIKNLKVSTNVEFVLKDSNVYS